MIWSSLGHVITVWPFPPVGAARLPAFQARPGLRIPKTWAHRRANSPATGPAPLQPPSCWLLPNLCRIFGNAFPASREVSHGGGSQLSKYKGKIKAKKGPCLRKSRQSHLGEFLGGVQLRGAGQCHRTVSGDFTPRQMAGADREQMSTLGTQGVHRCPRGSAPPRQPRTGSAWRGPFSCCLYPSLPALQCLLAQCLCLSVK